MHQSAGIQASGVGKGLDISNDGTFQNSHSEHNLVRSVLLLDSKEYSINVLLFCHTGQSLQSLNSCSIHKVLEEWGKNANKKPIKN